MVSHLGELPPLLPPPNGLEERVRSLTRLTAVLAAVALAGVALAVIAIVTDDDGGDASAQRIAQLDSHVDRLERRLANTEGQPGAAEVQRMLRDKADQGELRAVEREVNQMRTELEQVDADNRSRAQSVDALQRRVDEIELRVVSQQNASTATQP
jgi:hypothetical protein